MSSSFLTMGKCNVVNHEKINEESVTHQKLDVTDFLAVSHTKAYDHAWIFFYHSVKLKCGSHSLYPMILTQFLAFCG